MQQERERRRQEDTFIMIDGLACSRRESQAAVAQLFASFCCGWLFVRSLLLVVREVALVFRTTQPVDRTRIGTVSWR
jgi:hypothetical protein